MDLGKLPVLTTWPQDGGPFITLPCVITRDPKTGKRNVGMYRMQVYDKSTTGMHWQRQKNAAEQLRDRLRATTEDAAASGRPDGPDRRRNRPPPMHPCTSRPSTVFKGDRMEVAVAIGTDPATTFSAPSCPPRPRSRST